MKKSILTIAVITATVLASCNSNAEKVEKAEDKVVNANVDLAKANEDYLIEVEAYKKETAEKIAANEQSIAELEQKNSDMKKTMDDYKAEGKEKWESFKTEFSHDMDELGKAFTDLGTNNVK